MPAPHYFSWNLSHQSIVSTSDHVERCVSTAQEGPLVMRKLTLAVFFAALSFTSFANADDWSRTSGYRIANEPR